MQRSDAAVPTRHTEEMRPRNRPRNALLALIGWLLPPALGQLLYRGDADALAWMNIQAVFREHPGFYGFWCGVLYIQIFVLLVRTARYGRRIPALLFVLFGGFVNLLVAREPADSRIQLEPWGAQLLLSPLSAYSNTVLAPRLVCMWLAIEEIGDERWIWRAARMALSFHPVLLSLLCGWVTTPVLYASLVLWRAVSLTSRPMKDEIMQAHNVAVSDIFAATVSGDLFTVEMERDLSSGSDSDDRELPSVSLRETQAAYSKANRTTGTTTAAPRDLSTVPLESEGDDEEEELAARKMVRAKPDKAQPVDSLP